MRLDTLTFHVGLKLFTGIFSCLIFAAVCCGQTAAPLLLKFNVPVGGSVESGETRTFALHLESDQLAVLVLQQRGVDLAIALDDAKDNGRLSEVNFNSGRFGEERLLWANNAAPRDVLVRVFPARNQESADGRFSLALVELKSAKKRDKTRIAAQQSMINTVKLLADDKKEAKIQAIPLLENGLKLARESRDPLLEATALRFLQSAFLDSGEADKSIEFGKAAILLLAGEENKYVRAAVNESTGAALVLTGEYEQGIEILTEVLTQTKEFGGDSLQINVLLDLSYGYLYTNSPSKSLEYTERAFEIANWSGDQKCQIKSFITFTEIYVNREVTEKVIQAANRALSIGSQTGIQTGSAFD